MSPSAPVHEITLGGVKASIWEERRGAREVRESDFTVSIGRPDHFEAGDAVPRPVAEATTSRIDHAFVDRATDGEVRFGVEDLPLVAQVMDLAHLWIHEQSVGV